ncbi:sugar phosphatase SupH [Salmonella enterica subsp. enterica serovar Worthington str. ATCC 9607]|nr:sugar phosphatase SupH [Salmonella enterica subsp. enterica serovar Worthington str. ATCC 9607]KAF0783320.1 hypothetical protein L243_19440 [Salmonella enterica subsp. enterica serovar Worthington str. BCH-3008]
MFSFQSLYYAGDLRNYQLISFFPELKDEISFVAENGALVYEHGKQLFHGELT